MQLANSSAYGIMLLAGIIASALVWSRMARKDPRLMVVYVAALAGAFFGAKAIYLAAEGWMHWGDPDAATQLLTGKSITGALLGGYAGAEIGKLLVRYTRPTGDRFALIAPLGIMLGRIGCMLFGCCPGARCAPAWFAVNGPDGVSRWPAPQAEFFFNSLALLGALAMDRFRILPNQHFNLYLVAYGAFRFAHEFLRDTPRIAGPLSGYHFAAVSLVALGAIGFSYRQRHAAGPEDSEPARL